MSEKDWYIEEVIKKGDEGSALLAAQTARTLNNNEFIKVLSQGKNGVVVAEIPEGYNVLVNTATGSENDLTPGLHAMSMVENLARDAKLFGAQELIGLTDVVDASTGDLKDINAIARGLVSGAANHNIAIMNGELAVLGGRVTVPANINGTMISITKQEPGVYTKYGKTYSVFDAEGKPVYVNSDGNGTKLEFNERLGNHPVALRDSLAMKLDDLIKIGAQAKVVADTVETRNMHYLKNQIDAFKIREAAAALGQEFSFDYLINYVDARNRIAGFDTNYASLNISGSAVSTIDRFFLENPLSPSAGEHLLAIQRNLNPRANGITDRRAIMVEWFGNNYHNLPEAQEMLKYLSEPSTIFYQIFSDLIKEKVISSLYHMSGGAFNGKLAAPLAKEGLFVEMDNIFLPSNVDIQMGEHRNMSVETMYSKWPMGNEAFVTTTEPDITINYLKFFGYAARDVGVLEKGDVGGISFKAYNGERVIMNGE